MSVSPASRWLHRFAWVTAILTLLLPVATGAVVTTMQAGMAFADWPSSDGYFMLTYPWLHSARDQFVEHGHRLAGTMVGLLSVALALFAWRIDSRPLVRGLAGAIFGSVVVQGMLGGVRVLMDDRAMALIHGDFAACVFSLMGVLVLVTGPHWEARSRMASRERGRIVAYVGVVLMLSLMVQYFLGSLLRHFNSGMAWTLHPWFALVPVALSPLFVAVARNGGSPLVVRFAVCLLGFIAAQALLGLATWYVSKGVPGWGVVAERWSPRMIAICSLHKAFGALTLMTSVVAVVCTASVQPLSHKDQVGSTDLNHTLVGAVP